MTSKVSLTEELLRQDLESDLTRIILTVQSVVNIINNKLRSTNSETEDQLVSWSNQVWLDKLIKSKAVKMIVTRLASSMLEVDTEHQGLESVLVAFDPLTIDQSLDLVASSSFAVWRRGGSGQEEEDISSLIEDGESLLCCGLINYGVQTRVLVGGEGGATLYHLDTELGQLVSAPKNTVSRQQILSLPTDSPGN